MNYIILIWKYSDDYDVVNHGKSIKNSRIITLLFKKLSHYHVII